MIAVPQNYVVKKVGGINAGKLAETLEDIKKTFQAGQKQSVVISAMRTEGFNTTSHLIDLAKNISDGNTQGYSDIIDQLVKFHHTIIDENIADDNHKDILKLIVSKEGGDLTKLVRYVVESGGQKPNEKNEYSILANNESHSIIGQGEKRSSMIVAKALELADSSMNAMPLYINKINIEPGTTGEDLFATLSEELQSPLQQAQGKIAVIAGYVANVFQEAGRGYSDYTGALISHSLARNGNKNVEYYIQKSVPGLCSTNPSDLTKDRRGKYQVISHIDYDTAAALTREGGAAAKVVNEFAISDEMKKAGIKIRVGDPSDNKEGTIISAEGTTEPGIQFVMKRENGTHTEIYLIGQNIENADQLLEGAIKKLQEAGIEITSNESNKSKELSLSVLKKDGERALNILHQKYIVEKSLLEAFVTF